MNKKPKSEKIKLISSVKYAFIHDIDRRALTYLILVAAVLKLILTACQMVQIFPGEAPIDDELMFNAANSIKEGNWLGAYSWFTIAKHMFFSVWLWLLNLLHIPYLIGGQLLLDGRELGQITADILSAVPVHRLLFKEGRRVLFTYLLPSVQ